MSGFYNFIRGVTGKLGVGMDDRGLLRSQTLPNYSGIGSERQVRRVFSLTRQSHAMLVQEVPVVSPLGLTGLSLHGVPILTHLADKGK
jgi:hypothetical protein